MKTETLGDIRVELGAEEHYLADVNNPSVACYQKSMELMFTFIISRSSCIFDG